MSETPPTPQSPSGVLLELSQILTDKAHDIKRMAEGESSSQGRVRQERRSSSPGLLVSVRKYAGCLKHYIL